MPYLINYYYDWSEGDERLSSDPEGNLVGLCACCADRHEAVVDFASTGDEDMVCECCEASQRDGSTE